MTEYMVMLHRVDEHEEALPPEALARSWEAHLAFRAYCDAQGWSVRSQAALRPSRRSRSVRPSGDGFTVTDGPYAETAEQLGGFYLVTTDDLDALTDAVGPMLVNGGTVEIRPTVTYVDGRPVPEDPSLVGHAS
ncbi:hypothetical protein Cch01nite_41600 [Cellulomonas chitinilytica]|uniref:YCII-related domain-containing protein n=1 Tax=Cellulomonas chitinilytica TaxID=398759 RepID=A0A919U3M1_9CELL|nr:YciI family protein [Cellulomonas chitinilytica]GIG23436.1 hypothetical protein Cch01nite_41600 [Cellulomonas chitinilytica]